MTSPTLSFSMITANSFPPTRNVLLGRVANVLDFAIAYTDRLDEYALKWGEKKETANLYDQVVAETALLVLLCSRISNPPSDIAGRLQRLIQSLIPHATSSRVRTMISRFPQTAGSLGTAQTILSTLGFEHPVVDKLIADAHQYGHVISLDLPSYRKLGVHWLRRMVVPSYQPEFSELLAGGIVSSNAHPIHMSRDDTYALTHVVFFATDFGNLPAPREINTHNLHEKIAASLAWNLATEDHDLLCELLATTCLLGMKWSQQCELAWDVLDNVWEQYGNLFIRGHSSHLDWLPPFSENASTQLMTTYHPTYVMGMLSCMLLRKDMHTFVPCSDNHADSLSEDAADLRCEIRDALSRSANHQFDSDDSRDAYFLHSSSLTSLAESVLKPFQVESEFRTDLLMKSCSSDINQKQPTPRDTYDAILIAAIRSCNLTGILDAIEMFRQKRIRPSATLVESVRFLIRQQAPDGSFSFDFLSQTITDSMAKESTCRILHLLRRTETYLRDLNPASKECNAKL